MVVYTVLGFEHALGLGNGNVNRDPFTASRAEVGIGGVNTVVLEPRFNGFNGVWVGSNESIHLLLRQVLAIPKKKCCEPQNSLQNGLRTSRGQDR